jgi:hypothetical protein
MQILFHDTCFVHYGHHQVLQLATNKPTRWPESASELYRPSDCRLSAKLVPYLLREGATWSVRRIPKAYSQFSRPEPLLFFQSSSSIIPTRLSGGTRNAVGISMVKCRKPSLKTDEKETCRRESCLEEGRCVEIAEDRQIFPFI